MCREAGICGLTKDLQVNASKRNLIFTWHFCDIYELCQKSRSLKVRKNGVYLLEEVYTIYRPVTNMFGRIRDIKNIY